MSLAKLSDDWKTPLLFVRPETVIRWPCQGSRLLEQAGFDVDIVPDQFFSSWKSLDSKRFRKELDYAPPPWPQLVEEILRDFQRSNLYDQG